MNVSSTRMDHIDSIRAIAALLVIWVHVCNIFVKLSPAVALNGTLLLDIAEEVNFGWIGVLIFFAISGFVIPFSFPKDGKQGTKKFIISRFFRLFPLFWFSMIMSAIFLFWLKDRDLTMEQVFYNATMLPALFDVKLMMELYWTLQIELIFYALCLCLFMLGLIRNFSFIFCIVLICSIIFTVRGRLGINITSDLAYDFSFIATMFWGTVCRAYYDKPNKEHTLLFIASTIVILTPATESFIGMVKRNDFTDVMFIYSQLIPPITFLLLVFIIKIKSVWLSYLGKISYSMYLMHPIVFTIIYYLISNADIPWLMDMPLYFYLTLCLVFTILLSSLTYRFVEQAGINFARKSTKKTL